MSNNTADSKDKVQAPTHSEAEVEKAEVNSKDEVVTEAKDSDKILPSYDSIAKILSIALKAIPVLGAAIVFVYCFFHINYFPSGLSSGDTLFFIFIACGFSVCYAFLFFFSTTVADQLISQWWDKDSGGWKKDSERWKKVVSIIVGIVLLGSLCFIFILGNFDFLDFIGVVIFLACSIFFSCWVMTNRNRGEPKEIKRLLAFLLFFAPLILVPKLYTTLVNVSLESLGVSNKTASVSLSDEQYSVVRKIIEERGGYIFESCNRDRGNVLHNVRVLWNGVGEYVYLEVPYIKELNKGFSIDKVRFDLKKDQVHIFKHYQNNQAQIYYGCVNRQFGKLFDVGKSEIDDDKSERVHHVVMMVEEIQELYDVQAIRLYGTADSTEYKGNSNLKLSKDRAESVKGKFKKEQSEKVVIEGLGNFEFKTSCDDKQLSKSDLADCRAEDRGVLVQMVIHKLKERVR